MTTLKPTPGAPSKLRKRTPEKRNLEGTPLLGYRDIDELAQRLDRSTKTIRRWMKQGLPFVQIAGATYIHDGHVLEFFKKNTRVEGGNMPAPRTTRRPRAAA
jgi:hypothetical protein